MLLNFVYENIIFMCTIPLKSAVQCPLWCCVCIINSCSTLLNWPIVSLLILFILFSMFFVLIHDYTLCLTGSPCCNFGYYNYISIWPYYIVIHLPVYVTITPEGIAIQHRMCVDSVRKLIKYFSYCNLNGIGPDNRSTAYVFIFYWVCLTYLILVLHMKYTVEVVPVCTYDVWVVIAC